MARKSRKADFVNAGTTATDAASVKAGHETEAKRPVFRAGLYARLSFESGANRERSTVETQMECHKTYQRSTYLMTNPFSRFSNRPFISNPYIVLIKPYCTHLLKAVQILRGMAMFQLPFLSPRTAHCHSMSMQLANPPIKYHL